DAKTTQQLESVRGQVAIANAKQAHQLSEELFGSPRWQALEKAGARPQRLLWASTGVKDPGSRDTRYVEELIAKGVVNTVPPATLEAFRDHGEARNSLTENAAGARRTMDALEA